MSAPVATSPPAVPVLFFDGECGLCNRIVRILLRLDRRGVLRFAPLQGPTAQAYLETHGLPRTDFDSLIFVPDWANRDRREFLVRTDGVVASLRVIGGAGRLFIWLGLLPAAWRDASYNLIARCRYRFFGKWTPRPLPRAEWSTRFFE
jgi:predicted DCC family thiol-disulfide oxidoreductase YuxK